MIAEMIFKFLPLVWINVQQFNGYTNFLCRVYKNLMDLGIFCDSSFHTNHLFVKSYRLTTRARRAIVTNFSSAYIHVVNNSFIILSPISPAVPLVFVFPVSEWAPVTKRVGLLLLQGGKKVSCSPYKVICSQPAILRCHPSPPTQRSNTFCSVKPPQFFLTHKVYLLCFYT